MLHPNTNLRLYIIRHGESEANLERRLLHGQFHETPLTEKGQRQATKLGKTLKRKNVKFDQVYASISKRAIQTAEFTVSELGYDPGNIIRDARLVEYSTGDWNGSVRSEIYTPGVINSMNVLGPYFTPPNGESMVMVQRRIIPWLLDEIIYNERYAGKTATIGVFTHGMTIRVLLQYLMGFNDRLLPRIKIDNAGLSIVRFTENGWYVDGVNL